MNDKEFKELYAEWQKACKFASKATDDFYKADAQIRQCEIVREKAASDASYWTNTAKALKERLDNNSLGYTINE